MYRNGELGGSEWNQPPVGFARASAADRGLQLAPPCEIRRVGGRGGGSSLAENTAPTRPPSAKPECESRVRGGEPFRDGSGAVLGGDTCRGPPVPGVADGAFVVAGDVGGTPWGINGSPPSTAVRLKNFVAAAEGGEAEEGACALFGRRIAA